MGDILSSIFGTSSSTTQQTVPDRFQQEANSQRLSQILALFQSGGLYDFAGANPTTSTPTDFTTDISNIARENMLAYQNRPPTAGFDNNLMSLDQYINSFDPLTDTFRQADIDVGRQTDENIQADIANYDSLRGMTDSALSGARGLNYDNYATATQGQDAGYAQATQGIDARYRAAIDRGDYDLARSIQLSESGGSRALDINRGNYDETLSRSSDTTSGILGLNEANFQRGVGLNDSNLLRSLGISELDARRSLSTQDANRARALELGIGATGNYIDQIATPRLNSALALQGLESGGAVPTAIARATAETAMPYLQSIENAYGTNQANTLNSLMGLRGELTGNKTALDANLISQLMQLQTATGSQRAALEASIAQTFAGLQSDTANQTAQRNTAASESSAQGNRALGGQAMGEQSQASSNYTNNVSQLAQALMANGISLEQAGIAANSSLGQELLQAQNTLRLQRQEAGVSLASTYGGAQSQFMQSLPGASQALSLLPGQQQAQNVANLTSLAPLADFPRALQEQDFLRRQGLFTSTFTGIPFAPGTTTNAGSATGNIFDQLGGTIQSGLKGGGNIGG